MFKRDRHAPKKKKKKDVCTHIRLWRECMHFIGQFVTLHQCFIHRHACRAQKLAQRVVLWISCKWDEVLAVAAGQKEGGLPLHCNCPGSPSSADTQYHLSEYLDNWIWAGSRSGHYNQWHCQQCHWEPASSSCYGPPRLREGKGIEINVFSASWPDRLGDHKSSGWKILSAS